MPSVEREVSRDRSPSPKHKHSFSDLSRLGIPMWDSSDPERAPPPLPLNPQHPDTSPSKPNVSENVAQAAKALAERARANTAQSPYTPTGIRDRSPEKSPTRTPQHKRLQSLQQENFKNSKNGSENGRPSSPTASKEVAPSSPERAPSPVTSPSVIDRNEGLVDNGSSRRAYSNVGPRPILGENTPPSATILAIQNMPYREHDPPLSNITNSSSARTAQNMEPILSQMQNLTNIATTLQKEMATLSRRSKDNATDLVSLKEATKTRDEDIRKSLRELVTNARASEVGSVYPPRGELSRSASALDFIPRFLETKASTPSPLAKSASFPRVSQLNNAEGGTDFDRAGSPAPYSMESAASIAMLEKVIREMGTKDGQERLASTLTDFTAMSGKDKSELLRKLDDLAENIKDKSYSKALVKQSSVDPWSLSERWSVADKSIGAHEKDNPSDQPPSVSIVNEELRQALQKIKDSVAQGGGLTGEVKSLVRELRGEVLGMGRELGRKIDTAGRENLDLALLPAEHQSNKEEVERIVQDGLTELKEHMERLIQTKRRESSSSAHSRYSVDSSEVYALVKQSLADHTRKQADELTAQIQPISQDSIIAAVKEAYEACKPEIELQQFGLERDEILLCLKEGLEDYQATKSLHNIVSKDEIMGAVQDALQYFNPPTPVVETSHIKEEVLCAVRECLESFQRADQQKTHRVGDSISKDDILGAVREGLGSFKKEGAREIEINRDDLFQAVKAGLDSTQTPFGGYGDEVLNSLRDIVEGMRVEFKEYSAANGTDTSLVLDATKDGLEALRVAIESYVDRCRDVTGKEEVLETLRNGLEDTQNTVTSFIFEQFQNSGNPLAEPINNVKANLGYLQEAIMAQENRNSHEFKKQEQTLQTLTDSLTNLEYSRTGSNLERPIDEILDTMKNEFEQLRKSILEGSEYHKDELMDTLRITVGADRSDNRKVSADISKDIVDLLREELPGIRDSMTDPSLHDDCNRETNVESFRALLESFVNELKAQGATSRGDVEVAASSQVREEFERIHESLRSSLVPTISEKSEVLKAISEGFESLETQSRRLDDDSIIREVFDDLREELDHLRQSIESTIVESRDNSDFEGIIQAIKTGFEDLRTRAGASLTSAESAGSASEQIISAIQEVSSDIRCEVTKMAEKPIDLDMTVSYDILDTLKDGISGLRADIGSLKAGNGSKMSGDIVLSDGNPPQGGLSKDDLDRLELMITQLQIKVEAMDQNAQATQSTQNPSSVDSATREALNGIETMIYELRSTVDILVSRKSPNVSKDDMDAIETMLQNAKAKIDEQILPALDSTVTKEHLDAVEAVIRLTNESVDELATKLEGDVASKDEVAALYQLVEDANSSLKSLSQHIDGESRNPSKEDLDGIEILCVDIKTKIDQIPTSDVVPTKEDLAQITLLFEQFKDSHERFKNQYESDLEVTAKAFDDRKDESDKILDQMAELKESIAESKDEIKSRLKRGNEDVRALDEILQGIEDKIDQAPNAITTVQEVLEVINREFSKSQEVMANIRSEHDEASADLLDKHNGLREYLTGHFTSVLDSRFSEILTRHDEQQQVVEQAAEVMASKADQQDSLFSESRNTAEELKVAIELLGESVSTINPVLRDATDKMSDDAKTVFNKVEDLGSRMDLNYGDLMSENQLVRQEISKSFSGVGTLQDTVASFQPQVMALLSNLLSLSSEHYEYSKNQPFVPQSHTDKSSIEETIKSSFASLPIPRIEPPPSDSNGNIKTLHEKLDEIVSCRKQDDSELRSSVDELINRTKISEADLACLGKIKDIYEQLQITAREVSAFMAFQEEQNVREHQAKREDAQKAAVELTRCMSAKDDLERKIENLTETRRSLASDVESLITDRDSLTAEKSRLTAEVSSLETALGIRREELQEMDARAEGLERRIIDGVMDHSRALLMAKHPKNPPDMSLRRVPSSGSNVTVSTTTPSSVANAGVNIALSRKRSATKGKQTTESSTRRIVSLSRMSSNLPKGGGVASSRQSLGEMNNLKRSQSVKNPAVHKTPWVEQNSVAELDKENLLDVQDDESSRAATSTGSRSLSRSESHVSTSDRRTSFDSGPSELSYGTGTYLTGSYLTGSDSMRTTSYGSTIRSIVGGGTSLDESIQETDETEEAEQTEEEEEEEAGKKDSHDAEIDFEESELHEAKDAPSDHVLDVASKEETGTTEICGDIGESGPKMENKDLVIRPPDGYDSGLGSDLPTALAVSQTGSDYFASLVQDKRT